MKVLISNKTENLLLILMLGKIDNQIHQYLKNITICDRAWENWSYVQILYIEKYEFEILNGLFFSCGTIQSRQIYYINSVVI